MVIPVFTSPFTALITYAHACTGGMIHPVGEQSTLERVIRGGVVQMVIPVFISPCTMLMLCVRVCMHARLPRVLPCVSTLSG